MEQDMKETRGECRMYIAEKPFDAAQMCFGLPKNSRFKHFLSHEY